MNKGIVIGPKHCLNCSADLTYTSTENKTAFYTLNCSSRVRSPLSPATVQLIPVHHALATVFNFGTLEKVLKAKVSDHPEKIYIKDDLAVESPFIEFQSAASTAPICNVCYLVLSDLYRNFTEFTQLRKSDSFLGLKLKELESKLVALPSHQFEESISHPNQVSDLIHVCDFNPLLKNLEIRDTSTARNVKALLRCKFTTRDNDDDVDLKLNLLQRLTKLTSGSVALEKQLLRSTDSDESAAVGDEVIAFQTENVEITNILVQESESTESKYSFSGDQKVPVVVKSKIGTGFKNTHKPPNRLEWKSISCGKLEREGHAAVAVNGIIYSFGGYGGNNSEKDPIEIHILNTLKSPLQWKLLPVESNAFTPSFRSYHKAAAFGHLVFLWGGYSRNNKLYVFNTETMEWENCEVKGEVPSNRYWHTTTVVRNKMYVFGGYESGRGYLNSLKCLDLESLTWSSISPQNNPPPPRYNHSATVHGDRYIVIFGGWDDKEGRCTSLICFDVETNEWIFPEVTGSIPQPRKGQGAFNHNGFMYIFGGKGKSVCLDDLFCYDLETMEWKEINPNGPSPPPRWFFQSVVIQNQIFIFGGANLGTTLGDTFVLTIY